MRATPTTNGNGGWLKWAGVIITVLLLVGGFVMWCGSLSAHCGTVDIHHSTEALNRGYIPRPEYIGDQKAIQASLDRIEAGVEHLRKMHERAN